MNLINFYNQNLVFHIRLRISMRLLDLSFRLYFVYLYRGVRDFHDFWIYRRLCGVLIHLYVHICEVRDDQNYFVVWDEGGDQDQM